MWHDAPLSVVQKSPALLPDWTTNALCRKLPGTGIFSTTHAFGSLDLPGGENCARMAQSVEKLQGDSDGTDGPGGSGVAGDGCDG